MGEAQGGEYPEDTCKLCGIKENTMHLMFNYEKYCEPLWAVVSDVLEETVNRESKVKENFSSRLHAFLVLFNVTNMMILIQEIKRNTVLRRSTVRGKHQFQGLLPL